jgi:cell division protein FtsW
MKLKTPNMDMGIFVASLAMLGFGIVLVYSSSFAVAQQKYGGADFFLARQAVRAVLAVVLLVVFANIDYHTWIKYSHVGFGIAVVLLLYVLVAPHSHAIKGAKRWVSLGFISFQASEVARACLILFLARKLSDAGEGIRQWSVLTRQLLIVGAMSGLILLEPNFSTAFVVGLVGISLLFISGASLKHLGMIAAAGLPLAVVGMLGAGYRARRMMAFLNPDDFKGSVGYQVHQALIGLGNGGIFGRGLGQGEQKFFYLPEPHTDFVFSIMGEELGFIGLLAVMVVYGFIVYRGMRIALNAPDKAGQLTAFGFSFMLALYVILHAAVNTGMAPTTGVPLPFLSYGGMSLVFTMCGMGILVNISTQARPNGLGVAAVGRKRRGGRASIHA